MFECKVIALSKIGKMFCHLFLYFVCNKLRNCL